MYVKNYHVSIINDVIISHFYSMNSEINSFWDACEIILTFSIIKFQIK